MSQWTNTVDLGPTRITINGELRGARNVTMLQAIGDPRGDYNDRCQDSTNDRLRALVVKEDVGPFAARGLRPAVAALQAIFADVRAAEPDIHGRLGNMGMLCCRFVRGSTSAISNHSWGTAIDLTIDGVLDRRGDGRGQTGLLRIHPHFNRHGFFWGAAFPTEDAMHFEASDELVRRWQADGALGDAASAAPGGSLIEFGDRGSEVFALQTMLAQALGSALKADGVFGAMTRAAVIDFQSRNGLTADGAVGPAILARLREVVAEMA